jgi:hypothetical protein
MTVFAAEKMETEEATIGSDGRNVIVQRYHSPGRPTW